MGILKPIKPTAYKAGLLFLLLLLSPISFATEGLIIVANTTEKNLVLTKSQVKNLFMGGAITYELEPITLPPENITRILFDTKIVGLTESRIQSYWAQMRFSGRKIEPKQIENEFLVLEYLLKNESAIAYLPHGTQLPESLTIVYSID